MYVYDFVSFSAQKMKTTLSIKVKGVSCLVPQKKHGIKWKAHVTPSYTKRSDKKVVHPKANIFYGRKS